MAAQRELRKGFRALEYLQAEFKCIVKEVARGCLMAWGTKSGRAAVAASCGEAVAYVVPYNI